MYKVEREFRGSLNEIDISKRQQPCFPYRYFMLILSFFGFFNVYGMRVNLSIAIIDIMDDPLLHGDVSKGVILGSFFYGYVVTQIPGGILAAKFGGSKVLGIGIFSTAIFTILTPVVVRNFGLEWLVVLRVLQGFGEGVTYPAQIVFWSKWAPKHEKTRMVSIGFTGSNAGTVISMPLCGFLAQRYGWESVFYVHGCLALLWTLIWAVCSSDKPRGNRLISENEIEFIESNLEDKAEPLTIKDIPVKNIILSIPFLACITTHFCESWGFYTVFTELPTYMKNVLHFDLEKSGALGALPYISVCLMMVGTGFVADLLSKRNYLSTTKIRKLINTLGMMGQIIFLLLAGYSETSLQAVAFLTLAVGFDGLCNGTIPPNFLDLSPKYAGVLMGISNSISNISGIIAPIVAEKLTPHGSQSEWRNVFIISSEIYAFGGIVYFLFASGKKQYWNQL